ncbi:unnamed protein product [Didymodactylos carnosus]|uniref:Uncharacterized protein n=1 Tax=Didymodactylos carnosus TaxID=1234261 RepID=A0A8S2XAT9_9BILA|nr:unnamed protein product [Didymodactylos carnosus]CAF4102510.1 unnamed protein product [Didymodactylos carnosus]CAF4486387.1 unnamed protein product [Didymodactylos carnosus]
MRVSLVFMLLIVSVLGKIDQSTVDKDIADIDQSSKTWLSMIPDWYFKILGLMCKASTCCIDKRETMHMGQADFFKMCLGVDLSSTMTPEMEKRCPSFREIQTYYNGQGVDRFQKRMTTFERVHRAMMSSMLNETATFQQELAKMYCTEKEVDQDVCKMTEREKFRLPEQCIQTIIRRLATTDDVKYQKFIQIMKDANNKIVEDLKEMKTMQ